MPASDSSSMTTRRVSSFSSVMASGGQVAIQDLDRLLQHIMRQVFEQVSGVGGVQALDRPAHRMAVAIADRADEACDLNGETTTPGESLSGASAPALTSSGFLGSGSGIRPSGRFDSGVPPLQPPASRRALQRTRQPIARIVPMDPRKNAGEAEEDSNFHALRRYHLKVVVYQFRHGRTPGKAGHIQLVFRL